MALLGEVCHWRWVHSLTPLSVHSRYFIFVVEDVTTLSALPALVPCVHDFPPWWTLTPPEL